MRFEFPAVDFSALGQAAARVEAADLLALEQLSGQIKPGVRLTERQRRALRALGKTRKEAEQKEFSHHRPG